jgi:hypothetical protein
VKIQLDIPDVPPSINKLAHAHWRKWWKQKKAWQATLEMYLMSMGATRPLPSPVRVHGSLRFAVRRRRDEGNFRALLEKALGDALVNGGWIPDDTPEHFRFGKLSFEEETGQPRTLLTLELGGEA